jgi:hypothetical protein
MMWNTKRIQVQRQKGGRRPSSVPPFLRSTAVTVIEMAGWHPSQVMDTRGVCIHTFMYLYVCMFVCTYVCNVCMYVRTCVCTYIRTYVCMYICMYVRIYIGMYVLMCVCVCTCTYVCMYRIIFINCNWVDTRWQWLYPVAVVNNR